MNLRVLHVLDHSIPLHSGYTFRTLSILREQRNLGWTTEHLTSPKQTGSQATEENVDGWHFYRTDRDRAFSRLPGVAELQMMKRIETRLLELGERLRPDLIHAHSPVLNAVPALRVGRHLGIPVVYEVRAFWEDAAVDHGTTREGSIRYRLSRGLETWALKRADHVTTISEGLRADIAARGIPEERITVIPNAVDVDAFSLGQHCDEALKQRLGLGGCAVIGFIGSFYAYEGLDLLVSVMPDILRRMPDVRLLLVGGGPQEQFLRARVEALGLGERVIFAGRVPHDEVQRYYDLIDVLVYPRHSMRLTELVTPLKPLEAMAQGRLLVASDVGGHRELIRDGQTGVLFRADDGEALASAVVGLLGAKHRWPGLRAAGRVFVERERSWAASVARYRSVYADAERRMRAA